MHSFRYHLFCLGGKFVRNEKVEERSKWQHFKGSVMEIVCLAQNSEDLSEMVIYKHDNEL